MEKYQKVKILSYPLSSQGANLQRKGKKIGESASEQANLPMLLNIGESASFALGESVNN